MPDLLQDGQSVEVQGSASRPYVLKNVGGVFSCSCPGWRFQSAPIEERTCRHLRDYRGHAAEDERVGPIQSSSKPLKALVKAPPLLLAESWNGELEPTGYLLSEKLDGVRAYWDGNRFYSRQGNRYHAPAWFTAGLPLEPLDGELWIGRKKFQRTVSIVRRHDEPESWKEVRFLVFDAPAEEGPFETRLRLINTIMEINRPPYALAHEHIVCAGHEHLQGELARIEALSGEGLMLRQPGSAYVAGRSSTLLKVKRFHDAEARVIGHEPGTGKHKGRLVLCLCKWPTALDSLSAPALRTRSANRRFRSERQLLSSTRSFPTQACRDFRPICGFTAVPGKLIFFMKGTRTCLSRQPHAASSSSKGRATSSTK